MRHARDVTVLGLLAGLLACRTPSAPTAPAAPPAPELDAPETPLDTPSDDDGWTLEVDVDAVVDARLAAIDAEEAWPTHHADDEIAAFGPCVRPTMDQRAALQARVMTWVMRKHRPHTPTDVSFGFGCLEADGSQVVNAWVTAPAPKRNEGDEDELGDYGGDDEPTLVTVPWALRVRPRAIEQVFPSNMYAAKLIDIDGDGVQDIVTLDVRSNGGWELGGNPNMFCEVLVSGARGAKSAGVHPGFESCDLLVKRFVADDGKVTPVLALDLGHFDPLIYRCFSAAGPWVDCAAAQTLARRDRGRVWAQERRYDRESLAEGLALLGVAPTVREALVARAPASTSCQRLDVLRARQVAAHRAMLPEEQDAYADATRVRVVDAMFGGLGVARCGAQDRGQLRKLEAQAKQLRVVDTRAAATQIPLCAGKSCKVATRAVEVSDVCVGASGTTWVATWHLDDDGEDGSDIIRSLLVHSARGAPRVLAEAASPRPYYADECRGCTPSPLITTKLHLSGGSIVGLVARAGDTQLRVVVDDRVVPVSETPAPGGVWSSWELGFQFSPYDEGWRWPWREADTVVSNPIAMVDSPLVRVVAGEGSEQRVTFWYARPTGLTVAARFTMPELGERAKLTLEGAASPELQALLIASERRGLRADDEAGCAEAVELIER